MRVREIYRYTLHPNHHKATDGVGFSRVYGGCTYNERYTPTRAVGAWEGLKLSVARGSEKHVFTFHALGLAAIHLANDARSG